jgi:Tfp pilus assembly protein PilN
VKRSLNTREKRLLTLCVVTIVLGVNAFAFQEFATRRKALTSKLEELNKQTVGDRMMLNDRAFWAKRQAWLDQTMPYTNSAGKAQGQLLEDLRNGALDIGLKVENETLLEAMALDHANEVAVNLRLKGDQDLMLRWLLTLQSPEKFTAVKAIELELDTRSKEKTPQAQCNLTVARWFNPVAPPDAPAPDPQPAAEQPLPAEDPLSEPPMVNPLELTSPLEISSPLETS